MAHRCQDNRAGHHAVKQVSKEVNRQVTREASNEVGRQASMEIKQAYINASKHAER